MIQCKSDRAGGRLPLDAAATPKYEALLHIGKNYVLRGYEDFPITRYAEPISLKQTADKSKEAVESIENTEV